MIDKAIAKISKEMMKIDTPLAIGIEEHLTEICKTDKVAEKLLSEQKSLKDICAQITNYAKSQAKNGTACLKSDEVFAMVDEYYEINTVKSPDRINILDLL